MRFKGIIGLLLTFSFIFICSTVALAGNADLAELELINPTKELEPTFAPGTTRYTRQITTSDNVIDVHAISVLKDDGDPNTNATVEIRKGNQNYEGAENEYTRQISLDTGDNQVTVKVTDTSDNTVKRYDITITKISFEGFINGLTDGNPDDGYYHAILKENNTRFQVRPEAVKRGTKDDKSTVLRFAFDSINPAPYSSEWDPQLKLLDSTGAEAIDNIAGSIAYTNSSGDRSSDIYIEIPIQDSGNDLRNHYNEVFTVQMAGEEFFKIEVLPPNSPPDIELTFDKNRGYDVLDEDQIYYLPKLVSGDNYNFSVKGYPLGSTVVMWRRDDIYTDDVPKTDSTYPLYLFQPNAATNPNYDDTTTMKNEYPNENQDFYDLWSIRVPTYITEELSTIPELKYRMLRVNAWRDGANSYTSHTYYFVQDKQIPKIEVKKYQGNYTNTSAKPDGFGMYPRRYPQLRAKIIDEIGGIESPEDITIKYRPFKAGDDDGLDDDGFEDANQMRIIDFESRTSSRTDGEQIITFTPYDQMGEGEYVVKIEATDKAGNISDSDVETDVVEPYLFYLNLDQTGPRINNVSLNQKTIDQDNLDPQPVSPKNLDMYFEIYGSEDLIYGIRHIEEDGDWYLKKSDDIGYITEYLRTYFNGQYNVNRDGETYAKNGVYEIFIIADEEGVKEKSPGAPYDLNGNLTADYDELDNFIGSDWGKVTDAEMIDKELSASSYIGNLIYEVENDIIRTERRSVAHFKIEVDGIPPSYKPNSLQYIDGYPGGDPINLTEGEPYIINTGKPVFKAVVSDASEIIRDNIDVYFINDVTGRRVSGEVITQPTRLAGTGEDYQIEFQPVVDLTVGRYNLELEMTDEFNNENKVTFDETFEIVTTSSGEVKFSITEPRLNINQSSALEVEITDPELRPEESLRILVSGELVVANGKIVQQIKVKEDGTKEIQYRDQNYLDTEHGESQKEYYQEKTYKADGYDVLFFNNKRRIIIFSRLPLPTGRNRVKVEVVDKNGVLVMDTVEFMVDNYRHGFGFGRLLPVNVK